MVTLEEEWTRPQQLLAAVVYDAWHPEPMSERFRWPTFNYVAHEMRVRHRLDAREVLKSFPVLGTVGIGLAHYSAVFFDRLDPANSEALVGLTVAGLARAAGPQQDPVRIFLALLAHAGDQRRVAVVDPHEPQPVTITDQTFSRVCTVSPGLTTAMYELIRHEPSAITGLTPHHYNPSDGSWTALVGLAALDFADGITLDAYLTRIHTGFSAPASPPPVKRDVVPPAPRSSYGIDATQARGVMIGDGGTQTNYYFAPTSPASVPSPTPDTSANPRIQGGGSPRDQLRSDRWEVDPRWLGWTGVATIISLLIALVAYLAPPGQTNSNSAGESAPTTVSPGPSNRSPSTPDATPTEPQESLGPVQVGASSQASSRAPQPEAPTAAAASRTAPSPTSAQQVRISTSSTKKEQPEASQQDIPVTVRLSLKTNHSLTTNKACHPESGSTDVILSGTTPSDPHIHIQQPASYNASPLDFDIPKLNGESRMLTSICVTPDAPLETYRVTVSSKLDPAQIWLTGTFQAT